MCAVIVIEDEVIIAFNKMISKNWNGVYSRFTKFDVDDILIANGNESEIRYGYSYPVIRGLFESFGWTMLYSFHGKGENPSFIFFKTKEN